MLHCTHTSIAPIHAHTTTDPFIRRRGVHVRPNHSHASTSTVLPTWRTGVRCSAIGRVVMIHSDVSSLMTVDYHETYQCSCPSTRRQLHVRPNHSHTTRSSAVKSHSADPGVLVHCTGIFLPTVGGLVLSSAVGRVLTSSCPSMRRQLPNVRPNHSHTTRSSAVKSHSADPGVLVHCTGIFLPTVGGLVLSSAVGRVLTSSSPLVTYEAHQHTTPDPFPRGRGGHCNHTLQYTRVVPIPPGDIGSPPAWGPGISVMVTVSRANESSLLYNYNSSWY